MPKDASTGQKQTGASVASALTEYPVKVFLDANVVLEGRPLADLPWADIDGEGPILVLVTPQVLSEVDSKKRDGRLGKIARGFNQLISPAALGGAPVVLREVAPRVALGLAVCNHIDWNQYDDLDLNDGDSRVIAEILHTRGVAAEDGLFVSQDIKPLAFATRYGLRTFHMPDSWLRPIEPTPQDKAIQRLKQRVQELEITEPEFEIEITFGVAEPVPLYRVADLTLDERDEIKRRILAQNRKPSQGRDALGIYGAGLYGDHDSSLNDRYETYRDTKLPAFMSAYERKIERLYNQIPFSIRIANVGRVRADKFVAEIVSSEGWLHHKFVLVPPMGPPAPRPRNRMLDLTRHINPVHFPERVSRHEMEFVEGRNRTPVIVVNCEDFRHGQEWVFNGVFALDVREDAPATISARVTASNMHGAAEETAVVEKKVDQVGVFDLIDRESLRLDRDLLMQNVVDRAIESENYKAIEFGEADDGDDD